MKKQKISTRFFNFGLFLEGLKRLKVIGAAVAILSLVISALIPVVYWMEAGKTIHMVVTIPHSNICIPLYIVTFLSPFFFLTIFSYLHKRKESDFFHAIPYTRTCVYVSFVASALSLIFSIQILSACVSGILWAINPHTTFVLGDLISATLISMLTAALLGGLMTLSVTLSGTTLSTMLIFGMTCLVPRLVMFYLGEMLESNLDVLVSIPHYLQFDWFLPFGLFMFAIGQYRNGAYASLWSPYCIIYSIVVALLVFTLAWFVYKKRKSEMAGNVAPNRILQHIFRCLFTLPIVLLIPVFVYTNNNEFSLLLVIAVVSLLVYYLYELITTKRIKNLSSATPWLLALVGCMVIFVVAYYGVTSYYLDVKIKEEDVAYVSIDMGGTTYDTYQQALLFEKGTDNADIISDVCHAYLTTQACDKKDDYLGEYEHEYWDDPTYEGVYSRFDGVWREVKFKLKSGRELVRNVCFKNSVDTDLRPNYLSAIQMSEEILEIPKSPYFIQSIDGEFYYQNLQDHKVSDYFDVNSYHYNDVYATLYQEYISLDKDMQERVRRYNPQGLNEHYVRVNVRIRTGAESNKVVYIRMCFDREIMPKTYDELTGYRSLYWTEEKW